MNLVELLKSKGLEIPENFDVSSIETELGKMYGNSDSIPKDRFKQVVDQKNELQAKITELESAKESIEKKFNDTNLKIEELTGYKTKYETVRQERIKSLAKRNQDALAKLTVSKDDKRFETLEKLRSKFVVKAEGEDYTEPELQKNLEQFDLLVDAGVLQEKKAVGSPNTPPPAGGSQTEEKYNPFKRPTQ